MKESQLTELIKLQDLTFEAVLVDCTPTNWNGHGKAPKQMSKEERGNRAFDLKNADKCLSIFARITNIIDTHTKPSEGNIKEDNELQHDIDKVKDQAKDLLKQLDKKEQERRNVH